MLGTFDDDEEEGRNGAELTGAGEGPKDSPPSDVCMAMSKNRPRPASISCPVTSSHYRRLKHCCFSTSLPGVSVRKEKSEWMLAAVNCCTIILLKVCFQFLFYFLYFASLFHSIFFPLVHKYYFSMDTRGDEV